VTPSAVAKAPWRHYNLDEDVIAEAFSTPARSMEDLEPEIRDGIAEDALERSELIGFWVAPQSIWVAADLAAVRIAGRFGLSTARTAIWGL
jgi:hypothetical protein